MSASSGGSAVLAVTALGTHSSERSRWWVPKMLSKLVLKWLKSFSHSFDSNSLDITEQEAVME